MPQNNITHSQAGFSLLEYVLGLTVLAIVLVGVGIYLLSYPRQLDSIFQFRAVALAEAVAEQVISVKYDRNNNPYDLTNPRCGITNTAPACVNQQDVNNSLLSDFSAVDDFQRWCDDAINGETLASSLGLLEPHLYRDFTLKTCVTLPSADQEANKELVKKVTITVNVGSRDRLSFVLHRYNIQ